MSVSLSTEIRWFIPGVGPQLPKGGRSVTDSYSCEVLAGGVSAKLRDGDGAGAFFKIRTALHPPIAFGDVKGVPETWLRVEPEQVWWNPHGDRIEVRKRISRRKGVEVTHLEVGEESWWSLAIRARNFTFPRLPGEISGHLRRSGEEAVSCSYPTWLLGRTPNPAAFEHTDRRALARHLTTHPQTHPR
jgi:hypothetical protein